MDQQSKADQVHYPYSWIQSLIYGFSPQKEWKYKQNDVEDNSRCGVEWMKTDRTSVGIIDRVCQQVVCINNHCSNHYQSSITPSAAIEHKCGKQGDNKVEGNVNHVCDVE